MRRISCALLVSLVVLCGAPSAAAEGVWSPPVDGSVIDGLDARLAVVEQHLTSVDDTADSAAEQRDVIDAQVRAARVAADMHLVAIELRAEVQRLWGEWPEHADVDGAPAELAESVTDLVERLVDITAGDAAED